MLDGIAVDAEHDTADAGRSADVRTGTFLQRNRPLLLTVALAVVLMAGFVAIPSGRHAISLSLHGNLTGLRLYIRHLGFGGFALLFALILVHAVIPYPSEILTTTAGFVYGFIPGMIMAICGWTIVAVLTYFIGATVGRPVLRALLGKRFTDLEEAMEAGGVRLMLIARLLPVVPLALLGYVAGATRENLWRLVWTSFVGYLPLTTAVAYLGSQAKSFSATNPIVWIIVVALVAVIVGSHFYGRHPKSESAQPSN
jgi:uncharacterized membrane protein YdjX (TVP38/TMEM64 family)